ncbi:glutamine amidotransferase, subunit with HisF [Candidatus Blochmanniella floridana]|uniref:Imidazole glycerol phosphate synthase subunit HisH n=1 Tax=Blochmanniella floridana TaxID=203907 RepID=HIS5_BLOFL|nr:RecName: Full=Imidazole glycerol phosphate synthase subunit HisH; AltName: Full=IGP synthase glutaminase subunit; AltName: Full=IGP synthase subunit HisH; AltName: Full=ImGP synthase subunit HisH; Short=IGPS subunit HisH [Candidatus Blochmannia floridanus]CAD83525.1 glutamine amidotransferase, subunit with HisF [Candidatus Blochmannia floridanus]
MKIIIINTNCSNLSSVKIMLNKLGCNTIITDDPDLIIQSDKILLPGVGTANTAMKQLKKKNLIQLIKKCTQPTLGICLGMQLFGSFSNENTHTNTLNIINVPVKHMYSPTLPIPHMGWNNITILKKHDLLNGINNNHYFYFAHSYCMELNYTTIAYTNYGQPFSSVIVYKNFFGVQFHPEKSSFSGEQLIKNFLEI